MKNLLTICGLLLLMACSDNTSTNVCGDNLSFRLNEAKTLAVRNGRVTVEITSINDSRCPSDVVCVRAGDVEIDLKINSAIENASETHSLCIGDCIGSGGSEYHLKDTISSNLDDLNFKIVLHEVLPYPTSNAITPLTACLELLVE